MHKSYTHEHTRRTPTFRAHAEHTPQRRWQCRVAAGCRGLRCPTRRAKMTTTTTTRMQKRQRTRTRQRPTGGSWRSECRPSSIWRTRRLRPSTSRSTSRTTKRKRKTKSTTTTTTMWTRKPRPLRTRKSMRQQSLPCQSVHSTAFAQPRCHHRRRHRRRQTMSRVRGRGVRRRASRPPGGPSSLAPRPASAASTRSPRVPCAVSPSGLWAARVIRAIVGHILKIVGGRENRWGKGESTVRR
jgi:hypothetical protein